MLDDELDEIIRPIGGGTALAALEDHRPPPSGAVWIFRRENGALVLFARRIRDDDTDPLNCAGNA